MNISQGKKKYNKTRTLTSCLYCFLFYLLLFIHYLLEPEAFRCIVLLVSSRPIDTILSFKLPLYKSNDNNNNKRTTTSKPAPPSSATTNVNADTNTTTNTTTTNDNTMQHFVVVDRFDVKQEEEASDSAVLQPFGGLSNKINLLFPDSSTNFVDLSDTIHTMLDLVQLDRANNKNRPSTAITTANFVASFNVNRANLSSQCALLDASASQQKQHSKHVQHLVTKGVEKGDTNQTNKQTKRRVIFCYPFFFHFFLKKVPMNIMSLSIRS